jgi:hypothetical protein
MISGYQVDENLIEALKTAPRTSPRAIASDLQKFNRYSEDDVGVAIFQARRVLEGMIRSTCTIREMDTDRPLEVLLNNLRKDGSLSELIYTHCMSLKSFGNWATHPSPTEIDIFRTELSAAELNICGQALNVVVNWYCREVLPRLPNTLSLGVVKGAAIQDSHLIAATQIDRLVYPELFWGIPEVLFKWHKVNQDIFTLVEDVTTKKTVGCLTARGLSR